MSLTFRSKLGSYEVLSLLGAGAMGEVYRARDTRLGREVAIKVLPGERMATRTGAGVSSRRPAVLPPSAIRISSPSTRSSLRTGSTSSSWSTCPGVLVRALWSQVRSDAEALSSGPATRHPVQPPAFVLAG